MPVASQLKTGNTILLEGQLFTILTLTHITPGKGNAVVQTDLRNIKTGIKTNKRFRSQEDVETVDVMFRKMSFLYNEGTAYHFMDQENFNQYELPLDFLGDSVNYLLPNTVYDMQLYENQPIDINLPPTITLKIIETDPPQKGNPGKTKIAKLETGLSIQIPLFLAEGESVIINTSKKEYLERAK